MGINIADNFQYLSQKPLDGRTKYDTTAAMKAVSDSSMYDGCLAYCSGTGKTYQWKSSNSVDATLGRWREFESGGGFPQTDIEITNQLPTATHTLAQQSKRYLLLGNGSSDNPGGVVYECAEDTSQNARWIPLTQIASRYLDFDTDDFSGSYPSDNNDKLRISAKGIFYRTDATTESTLDDTDKVPFYDNSASGNKVRNTSFSYIKSFLKTYFDTLYNKYVLPTATSSVLGGVKIGENMLIEDGVINPSYTVVATKFNKADIYSATEKVIGCWTDGRPIYQKTYTIPANDSRWVLNGTSWVIDISRTTYFPNSREILHTDITMVNSTGSASLMIPYVPKGTVDFNAKTFSQNSAAFYWSDTMIRIFSQETDRTGNIFYLTVKYTKTTDAANSFKYADENDYSTSEKIVGTWTNGANLYQRTYTGTLPSNFCSTDYSSTGTYDVSFNSSYTVRAIEGGIHTNTYDVMLNDSWGISPDISFLRVLRYTAKLQFQGNRTVFNSASYYLTVKYTK